jgi:hypothetical protein
MFYERGTMNEKLARFKKKLQENADYIGFGMMAAVTILATIHNYRTQKELTYIRSREWRLHEVPEILEMLKDEASHIVVRLHGNELQWWAGVPKN